ncbi:hypothetical protein QCA50_010258 [Cerrena zonata]|uniref:Yeast cell wall synthesis Kre9/Knh1-like N-terminal domain-containing protein n=1 Tax=Cerrena zonata TaxID=2478898 RepID=A0AAW0G9P1_9APHY
MFAIISTLALLAPLASAITFSVPTDWASGTVVTANWTTLSTDPTSFSLELNNPELFHQALALSNNVGTSTGTITFTLPIVQADSRYVLQAVNVTNINQVFAETPNFAIADTPSSSAASSTSSSAAVSSGASSASSAVVTPATTSTTPFGVTRSNTATGASSGATSGTGTGTSSSAGSTPSSFNGNNNGALSNLNAGMATWTVAALTAVFGCMTVL